MALAPATISEGILGLEAIHNLRGLEMNNKDVGFPRIVLDKINGIHGRADGDDNREPRRGHMGEWVYPSALRGRTITYEGRIQGLDLVSMRAKANSLRSVFASSEPEDPMLVSPPLARGGVAWIMWVKPLGLDLDDEQAFGPTRLPTGFQRTFTASVRQSDPRYYVNGSVSIVGSSGQIISVTNLGNAPAEPWFVLTSLASSGDITLQRLDGDPRSLIIDGDTIRGGGAASLSIDFKSRVVTAVDQPGSDYSGAVKFSSNWWDDQVQGLISGAQMIRVTGAAWNLQYHHASY
jgi:hypothetical protein